MTNKNRQHTISINGEAYYTAQKAQEVLSMSYSGLKYQVLIGNIKSEIPKGRRQSYYRAEDVEQVSRDLKSFLLHRSRKSTKFKRLTKRSEMTEIAEMSQEIIIRVEENVVDNRMEILAKNPDTYYILENENEIVGYTAMWPLKLGKINSILTQSLPINVSIEDIEDFDEGKNLDIYINAMHVKKGIPREEKRFYGARLISGLTNVIENLADKGIVIGTIAARSNMPEGIKLMKGIGFTEIEPLTLDRRTFIINVKESGIPFIMKYKIALHKWQNRQN